jgi:hypothetical protein
MVFVLFYLGYYLDSITDLEQSRIEGGPELFLYTSQVSYTTMMLIYTWSKNILKEDKKSTLFCCCWNPPNHPPDFAVADVGKALTAEVGKYLPSYLRFRSSISTQ